MVLFRINNYSLLLLVFVLLVIYLPSGIVEGFSDGTNPTSSLHKDGVRIKTRKHLVVNAMLDYDDAGPNPKHDLRKGKPGGGGKNP